VADFKQYTHHIMLTYLALGDSYTIGEQVPYAQNFPMQTVALLQQKNIQVAQPVIVATTLVYLLESTINIVGAASKITKQNLRNC
jgi:hypothetical protein